MRQGAAANSAVLSIARREVPQDDAATQDNEASVDRLEHGRPSREESRGLSGRLAQFAQAGRHAPQPRRWAGRAIGSRIVSSTMRQSSPGLNPTSSAGTDAVFATPPLTDAAAGRVIEATGGKPKLSCRSAPVA